MPLDVDQEGFLRNLSHWNENVATELALLDNISLTTDHWDIIHIVRDYYRDHHISPATRVLVNITKIRLGADKGKSLHLMQLFSGKPAKTIARIAGLPKPSNCD